MSTELVGRRFALFIALAGVAGAIVLAACSTKEAPAPAGTLELVIAPESIELVPGAARHAQATITRGGSFTGDVGFTVNGSPAGVSVAIGYIYAGSTTAMVDVEVDQTVAPGTKTVVIRAVGGGPAAVTATATLTVVVVAASGSVSLSTDPNPLFITAGGNAVTSTIALERTSPFAGPVDLTVTGVPTGITASVSPDAPTGPLATLSISAAPGARNGVYRLVLRGTGNGIADAIAFVSVTVTGGESRVALGFEPNTVAVTAGGASATSVVTRTGNYPARIYLVIRELPSGFTAGFPSSPRIYAPTATLTVRADATVAPGTYKLTVTAEATYDGIGQVLDAALLPVVVSAVPGIRR